MLNLKISLQKELCRDTAYVAGHWKVAFYIYRMTVSPGDLNLVKMKNISRLVNFAVTFNSGVE